MGRDRKGERKEWVKLQVGGEWLGRDFNIEIAPIAGVTDDEKLQSLCLGVLTSHCLGREKTGETGSGHP